MKLKALALILFVVFSQSMVYSQPNSLDPELLKDFRLVEEEGETVIEIGLGSLLRLTLQSSNLANILKINLRIAEENFRAAKESLNPTITASFEFDRQISPFLWKGAFESQESEEESPKVIFMANDIGVLSTTWSKKSDKGIIYALSYRKLYNRAGFGYLTNWGENFSGWSHPDESIYTDTLAAAIQIPIFQDWGDVNKMLEYKSRTALKQTSIESRKNKLELLKTVADIYWDMVAINENINALKTTVRLAKQLVEDTKLQHKLGLLDSIEIKQTESQLAIVRQSLLQEVTRKKQIEDQVRVMLNLEEFPFGYKPTEKLNTKKEKFDFAALLKNLRKNNQDLELLKTELEKNQLDLQEARNKAKTDIDFNAQYQLNNYENNSKYTGRFNRTGLHDYKVGLTWRIPLFDKITPQKIKQLELEKTKLKIRVNDKNLQLKTELLAIFRNLELNRKGIELAKISFSLVQDLFNKETERYKEGKTTAFRVSQIQQDLINAQKNEILAKVRYEKTFLSLLTLTELIFPYYKL